MSSKRVFLYVPLLISALVLMSLSIEVYGWAETNDDDFVVDAPWRTMRNYVPVLFFAPEVEGLGVIRQLSVSNWDVKNGRKLDTIFQDSNDAELTFQGGWKKIDDRSPEQDIHRCNNIDVEIIDPMGRLRPGINKSEEFKSFWHYIARIPVACIGTGAARGKRGVHFLKGEIKVQQSGDKPGGKTYSRVMRIAVDDRRLPRFDPQDRHYDVHLHTIAEQTTGDPADADSARKMFGGPIAMVVESAYVLDLVSVQLKNANFSAFRDLIATTDHSNFFSSQCVDTGRKTAVGTPLKKCFDDGKAPGYGPTAGTDGPTAEFEWYRDNFGPLGAEEVTLVGAGNLTGDRYGSHYLLYGAPHIEGPWHGGNVRPFEVGGYAASIGAPSPATLDHVHRLAAQTDAFGYAAHPFSKSIGWPTTLREQAIGFHSNIRVLNETRDDFIFKGFQLWNGVGDYITRRKQVGFFPGFPYRAQDNLDPFTLNQPPALVTIPSNFYLPPDFPLEEVEPNRFDVGNQIFVTNPARLTPLHRGLDRFYNFLSGGLYFTFNNKTANDPNPKRRFIRKLYIAAGTDAHGDFNFETAADALVFDEVANIPGGDVALQLFGSTDRQVQITDNAFGRVRTYTLTSDRLPPPGSVTSRGFSSKKLNAISSMKTVSAAPPRTMTSSSRKRTERNKLKKSQEILTSAQTQSAVDLAKEPQVAFDPNNAPSHANATSILAYREGNTILTSNPICKFNIDSNCRFDSETLTYHDASCGWENADGQIGGSGKMDGGQTALVVRKQGDMWINSIWDDLPTYHPDRSVPASIDYDMIHIARRQDHAFGQTQSQVVTAKSYDIAAGPRREDHASSLGISIDLKGELGSSAELPQALMLRGQTSNGNCVTNPVWLAPVDVRVEGAGSSCKIPAGTLTVALTFPMTMESTVVQNNCVGTTSGNTKTHAKLDCGAINVSEGAAKGPQSYAGTRVYIQPLDKNGNSVEPAIELNAEKRWEDVFVEEVAGSGSRTIGIKNARLIVKNAVDVPCPADGWNTVSHEESSGLSKAFVITARDIRDMHGNELNPIGKTVQVGLQAFHGINKTISPQGVPQQPPSAPAPDDPELPPTPPKGELDDVQPPRPPLRPLPPPRRPQ